MIGRLKGELVHKQAPNLLIDVNGVGYELEAPLSTFFTLPDRGKPVTLFTHLAIREDAHVLYGFATESERALFRSLLKVSGIGAKMALAILSGMSAEEFSRCVESEDLASLVRLPGIGRKTAERLIVEMRDRLAKLGGLAPAGSQLLRDQAAGHGSATSDAVAALVALGYKPQEASRMVKTVAEDEMDSETLIRAALQNAVQR
ncbi:MAG: Holliday junction branch migration protein RuvA [gamma proteobacterium symbiont of Ctena orbiculata]|nr:Holliday junction branch migration protein RuvA [Candidatus Thiodiazotropha taylori]MBT3058675.1 Holliday junction branch migration protein RuvA [Candidatus Thiodiazotropha sp. (ex Lucina pensylvanica)]MBV2094803.1 Holliday junction branch migration protein RuvA [Candidatus Thiodiazotropha sp. (ex Codakia orbicularis)]PUB73397.1 MAG: Holliday junction branch migration protein RuvA [gamma proteobacterium symbiont of Ctena orbiculata]MBT3064370.1 Holliday junction branch migration protein RuvA